jgi:dCMP deaminase
MKWIDYFSGMARYVSSKSKDPSTKVGAVATMVGSNQILETGYNGLPRGVKDLPERYERPEKYLRMAHAEANLVATAARSRLAGSTVYVTHPCCNTCMIQLINSGVSRIVYGDGETHMEEKLFDIAIEMANEAGVAVYFHADGKASELTNHNRPFVE